MRPISRRMPALAFAALALAMTLPVREEAAPVSTPPVPPPPETREQRDARLRALDEAEERARQRRGDEYHAEQARLAPNRSAEAERRLRQQARLAAKGTG